jgi:hypothetical protein
VVSNLSGTLTTNSTFTLFSATASAGNFASISGSPGDGLAWTFNPTNGVLSVVPGVTTPVATNITAKLIGNQLVLDWPAGQNWRLESQTNLLSTGLTTTNWTAVTPTPVPPYTNTVVPGNPTVFFRLVYP